MSDATWARYARLAFWMAVWGAITIAMAIGSSALDWSFGEAWAKNLFNNGLGVLFARYIFWHEKFSR